MRLVRLLVGQAIKFSSVMKIRLRCDRRRLLMGLILILLTTGCVSNSPYPVEWPPLSKPQAKDCQYIVGTYDNQGEMIGYPDHPSLAGELFGFGSLEFAPDTVSFSLPDPNTLVVTVLGTEGEVFRRTLSTKDDNFICQDGHAVVTDFHLGDANIAFTLEWDAIELMPSADYLIAKVRSKGAAVFFFVFPVMGESTSWYRFKRLHDRPALSSEIHVNRRD